jgi:aspartyl-tRNA(Asn)/glutamyl-tRNA(Gln) amidotransferase subunit B
LIHRQDLSLVDFNRTGIPLLEIVSEPDLRSPQEAHEYLTSLKSLIEYLDVSDCDMEKGSLRCDANISIRPQGVTELGVKTELKNMNSFKAVKDALAFEIERQTELLESGEPILQDTRLWDAKESKTFSMRTKEGAQDYRYFPEPDLPPFIIAREKIEEIKKSIPELPRAKMERFIKDYGLSAYDAKILVLSKADSVYAQQCLTAYEAKDKKPIANWLIGPLLSEANNRNCGLSDLKVAPAGLIELVGFVERDEISNLAAKAVLTEMVDTGKPAAEIVRDKNLIQISDADSLGRHIKEAIQENAKTAADYRQGKTGALMFLVGQVMKKSQGKANPKVVQELLKKALL